MNTILFVGEHSKTFDVQWHAHDHWELVYCTGGECTFRFSGVTVLYYRAGDTVAIPPRELHCNTSSEGFTNIHLRMEEPSFPYKSPFRVTDDLDRHLHTVFLQAQYFSLVDINKKELIMSALGELLTGYMVVLRSNADFSDPVEQIRNLILRDFSKPDFALDKAIREMPFHYDYLRKLFKKEVGVTPLEYLIRVRMKKAETILSAMSGDYSVAEIARLCGYDDALYFSRVFKKSFGCSPTAFARRRQAGQDQKE